MMSNYIERAKKFIAMILPYLTNMNDPDTVGWDVYNFNSTCHRSVKMNYGIARIALITSDYVVKYTYDSYRALTYGGGEEELEFYDYAKRHGFEYLLAEITRYEYEGKVFYIMPRINRINPEDYSEGYDHMTSEEYSFFHPRLYDLHSGNYGWKDGHIVIIDYACFNRNEIED